MAVLLPEATDRTAVMATLRAAGVQSSMHYPPVHLFDVYRRRYPTPELPNTEAFAARQLTLPLHPALTDQDVEKVVTALAATSDDQPRSAR